MMMGDQSVPNILPMEIVIVHGMAILMFCNTILELFHQACDTAHVGQDQRLSWFSICFSPWFDANLGSTSFSNKPS